MSNKKNQSHLPEVAVERIGADVWLDDGPSLSVVHYDGYCRVHIRYEGNLVELYGGTKEVAATLYALLKAVESDE